MSDHEATHEATPRGKIGRLAHELREEVNNLLRDNATAESIIAHLKARGVDGVTPQNVTNWKQNGFQKWLRNQSRIEEMRAQYDFAKSLADAEAASGIDGLTAASDAAARVAISQIMAVLEEFSPGDLAGLMSTRPDKFMELVHALSSLRKGDQEAAKLRMKVDAFKRAAESLLDRATQKGAATPEDIRAIFAEAYGVK